jgi:glycosyltransferase involved in cell wall biosynthesis
MSSLAKRDALIVVGRLGYPGATAPSNRVHLYCKALKHSKAFPFVINLHSTFIKRPKFNYLARNEGIPFYFAQKTPMRQKNFLIRNANKIKGIFNTIFMIHRLKNNHCPKVLFYNTEVWDEIILFGFLKMMNIPIIRDCSEIPMFIQRQKTRRTMHNSLLRIKMKMYHDLIVISDHLNSFYSVMFPKSRIFQIPILVDLDRFKDIRTVNHSGKIITYIGSMDGNKDGLENLIEAMALVYKRIENARLHLVGSAPKEDIAKLKSKVSSLKLDNIITFLGKKTTDEIPSILVNSDLLVLARPNNSQAQAGFPTKLGEYLASTKPVVITTTGEIPKYLKDKESAYLSKPDDVNDFANKMIYALSDQNAECIGQRGYEIAKNNFNYQLYGRQFIDILES